MQRFHIKSIILGIGIGMIITSIISIIYLAGSDPTRDLTKEQIEDLAVKYHIIDENNSNKDESTPPGNEEKGKTGSGNNAADAGAGIYADNSDSTQQAEIVNKDTKTEDVKPENTAPEGVEPVAEEEAVTVSPGDTSEKVSEKLYDAGIIKDQAEFVQSIINMKAEDRIQIGEYRFKRDSSIDGVINKLIKGSE